MATISGIFAWGAFFFFFGMVISLCKLIDFQTITFISEEAILDKLAGCPWKIVDAYKNFYGITLSSLLLPPN